MAHVHRLVLLAVTAAALATASPAFAQSAAEPLAWPAPSTTELQITREPSGVACPEVGPATPPASGNHATSGGCYIHVNGAHISLPIHSFGIEYLYTICDMEFDLRINSKGLGYAVHQELTRSALYDPGSCVRRPCHYPAAPNFSFIPPDTRNGNHNEGRPWRVYAREVNGVGRLTILFCFEQRSATSLEPSYDKRHMEVTIPFTETANHRYRFTAPENDDACTTPDQLCEMDGEFVTEATQLQGPGTTEATRGHVEINHVP